MPQDNYILSDLLYVNEHLSCRHYKKERNTGFRYIELNESDHFRSEKPDNHHILFFVEGEVIVNAGNYSDRVFKGGEMILVPRSEEFEIVSNTLSKIMIFGFDSPHSNCDKLVLQSYWELCRKIDYNFAPTSIRYPLTAFLELLTFCLRNQMNCNHLHELKHRELFLLIRGYYSKEEIAALFYPIVGKSLDFKDFILQNYKKTESISSLIELSNLGRSNFFKKFKDEFGMSAKQWMDKQKLQEIMYLAVNPELSAKEIMYSTGFVSTSHFNRFCRQQTGCSTTELLDKLRKI